MNAFALNGHAPVTTHSNILPELDFPAFEMEMTCRQAVGILRVARPLFDGTQTRREDFDLLCNSVEEWLRTEIGRLRFARTRLGQTALDS
jgi:hypothetical protein